MDKLNLLAENIIKFIAERHSELCKTAHIDCDDLRGTRNNTTCTKGIAEGVVCKLVAKTTTRSKGIHRVRHVDKETVSLTHLLRTEVHKGRVNKSTLTVRQDACGKYWERQKLFVPLLAEPLHKEFLKLHETIHVRLSAIRIVEVPKHLLHVRVVEYRDIPENTLVTTGRSRLIQAIDNTLKLLLDFLCVGFQVVFAILLAREVVKIMEEFHSCYCTCKVRCHLIHKVHKGTTECLKICRCLRDTTHALCSFKQERVQGDRSTIGLQTGFIMHIDVMVPNIHKVFIYRICTIHFLQLATNFCPVNLNGVWLINLSFQGADCLVGNIGIGIYL